MIPDGQEKKPPLDGVEQHPPQTRVHALDDHRPSDSIRDAAHPVGETETQAEEGDPKQGADDRCRDEKPQGLSIRPTAEPEHNEANDEAPGSGTPNLSKVA